MYCTRAVGRIIVQQRRDGTIVNTSSLASLMTPTDVTAYAVAKAAVNYFTRCMAVGLAPSRVRVNGVLLGTSENAGPRPPEDFREHWLREAPMHRRGRADEVSPAVLYLASEASSFVTGALLHVSGGIGI